MRSNKLHISVKTTKEKKKERDQIINEWLGEHMGTKGEHGELFAGVRRDVQWETDTDK